MAVLGIAPAAVGEWGGTRFEKLDLCCSPLSVYFALLCPASPQTIWGASNWGNLACEDVSQVGCHAEDAGEQKQGRESSYRPSTPCCVLVSTLLNRRYFFFNVHLAITYIGEEGKKYIKWHIGSNYYSASPLL